MSNSVSEHRAFILAEKYAESIIQNRQSDFDNALRIAIIKAFIEGYKNEVKIEDYISKEHSSPKTKYQKYMNECVIKAFQKGNNVKNIR